MHSPLAKLNLVQNNVNEIVKTKQLKNNPNIIVVTKKFSLDKIIPLLDSGHIHFGENKLQEAESKWVDAKKNYTKVKLHMIGKLQSNKAKKAVKIFDYIHSLDNAKLASKISQYEKELNKKTKLFIQVNVASEPQKSGIQINELDKFYYYCTQVLSLDIVGLMCLPPVSSNPNEHFITLKSIAIKLNLKDLSMGMSSDYIEATLNGATYLRLGTIILGQREPSI